MYFKKYRKSTTLRLLTLSCLATLLFIGVGGAVTAYTRAGEADVNAAQTVPYRINYQGRLTDNNGNALPDGDYNIRFKLFNAATGGTQQWAEEYTGANRVTLTSGLFNLQLGSVTALPPNIFSTYPLYLEVELPTPSTAATASPSWAEGPFTPRQQLASAPYAFNADQLDGYDATDLAKLGEDNTFTGNNTVQGSFTADGNVILGNAATDLLTFNGTIQGANPFVLEGLTANGFETTIAVIDPTADHTITLPNATGTVCLSSGNCTGSGGGGAPFDATYLTLSNHADLSSERVLTAGANLSVTDGGANAILTIATVQNPTFTTSVTTPQLLLTNSGFTATLQPTTLTADRTYTLPDVSGTFCMTSGNCAGTGGNGDITGSGVANQIAYFDGTKNITSSANLLFNGTDLTVGTDKLFVNGTSGNVGIGTTAPGRKLYVVGDIGVEGSLHPVVVSNIPRGVVWNDTTSGVGSVVGHRYLDNGADYGVSILFNAYKPGASTVERLKRLRANYAPSRLGPSAHQGGLVYQTASTGSADTDITDWTTRFIINNAGNVGIGTTTPAYKLDVSGGTGIVAQFSGRVIGGQAVNSNEFITLGQLNTTADATYFKQGGNSFGALATLGTNDANALALETNGVERLRVDSIGNVGIGIATPGNKLHVLATTGVLAQLQTTAVDSQSLLHFANDARSYTIGVDGALNDIFKIRDANAGLDRLVVDSTGNVGIGTTAPGYKLDVSGGDGSDIFGRFTGRVIGSNAVNSNEFVTKSQLDSSTGSGTKVSSLNTLTGDVVIQGNAQVGATVSGQNINLSIQADSIGDSQLAFNTGQHLTTTSTPTFGGLTVNGNSVLQSNVNGILTDSRIRIPMGTQSANTMFSGWVQNLLTNWDLRGGTYATSTTGGASISGATNAVRVSDGNSTANITTGATGGDAVFEFSGVNLPILGDITYWGYIQHRSGPIPGTIKIEYKNDLGTWVTHINDTSPSFTNGLWMPTGSFGSNPTQGVRFTLTYPANTTDSRIAEFGVYHRNQQFGRYAFPILNENNNFYGSNNIMGSVGIGTTSPGAFKLNVQGGNVNFSGTTTSGGNISTGGLYGFNANSTGDKIHLFDNLYGIGIESSTLTNWSNSQFRWRTGGTSASSGTQRMLLSATALSVGVNTSITGTLSVSSTASVAGALRVGASTSTTYDGNVPAHGGILLKSSGAQGRTSWLYQSDAAINPGTGGLFMESTHGDMVLNAGTVINANILLNAGLSGKVGIGTTTPDYKLDVEDGDGTTIVGRFTGRVIGANAVNADEFVTKSQLDGQNVSSTAFVQGGNSFAAPAILGTNDAQDLVLETSGAERLRLAADGSHITMQADAQLRLSGNSNSLIRYQSADGGMLLGNYAATGYTYIQSNRFEFQNTTDFATNFKVDNAGHTTFTPRTNSTTAFQVQNAGGANTVLNVDTTNQRVGIGTANPSDKLEVRNGSAAIHSTGTQLKIYDTAASDPNDYFTAAYNNNQLLWRYRDDSAATWTDILNLESSGNVGIGTTAPGVALHTVSSGNSIARFESSTNASSFIDFVNTTTGNTQTRVGDISGRLALYAGGTEKLSVLGGGNVGIGTTSPGEKLHVAGGSYLVGRVNVNGSTAGFGGSVLHVEGTHPSNSTSIYGVRSSVAAPSTATNIFASILAEPTTTSASFNISNLQGVRVGLPNLGAGTTVTNADGIYIRNQGNAAVGTAVGLRVEAQTGATNNYAAIFEGGNVGIGTTAPGYKLDVSGGDGSTIFGRFTGRVIGANAVNSDEFVTKSQLDSSTGSGTKVSSLNTLTGDVTIQGNTQVGATVSGQNINLSIQADSIGDTQLAFNTGQHLTTTSSPTFAGLTVNGNFTQTTAGTFSTGTGSVSLNGNTSIASGSTLTLQNGVNNNQIILGWNAANHQHAIRTRHNGTTAGNNSIDFNLWTPVDAVGTVGTLLAARLEGNGQLQLPVQGSAAGLMIGGDASLYRSAAATLTGQSLNVTTGIRTGAGVGTLRLNDTGVLSNITGITNSGVYTANATSTRDKIRVWNNSLYTIGMQSALTFGYLADYAMTFQMNNDADRGFWWGHADHTQAQGAMSLTTGGQLYVNDRVNVGGNVLFSSGGVNSYINTGNVGIGTVAPETKLEVRVANTSTYSSTGSDWQALSSDILQIRNEGSGNFASLYFRNLGSSGQSSGRIALVNGNGGRSDFAFLLRSNGHLTSTDEKLRVTHEGNVGIGTTGPNARLTVVGTNGVDGSGVTNGTNAPLAVSLTGGRGGHAPNCGGGCEGGDGGNITLTGGAGGNAFNSLDMEGSGGQLTFQGGAPGTGGMTAGTYGNIVMQNNGGNVGIGVSNPTFQLQLSQNSAGKPTSNTWTVVSDSRLKRDVSSFGDGLGVLRQINPVNYTLNGLGGMPDGEQGIGVIAQDIQGIAPYTIGTFKAKLNPGDSHDTELLSFDSSALTFVTINAVKELDNNARKLRQRVARLEAATGQTSTANYLTNGSNASFRNLNVSGTTNLNSLTVKGATHFKHTLRVDGSANFNGKVTVKEINVSTDITVGGRIISKGRAPVAKIGKALEAVDENHSGEIEIDGTDTAGTIKITIKDTFGGSGEEYELGIITFHKEYEVMPRVVFSANNAASARVRIFLEQTKTGFIIKAIDKPVTGTDYSFNYHVIGSESPDTLTQNN